MMTLHKPSRRNIALSLALALVAVPALASAGTYSIVGVDWYPSTAPGTGTNGGYIHFDTPNHPLDLLYGIVGPLPMNPVVVQAPSMGLNVTRSITVMGTWQWKIRWVGAAGEAHPEGVSAVIQYKGNAAVGAQATAQTGYSSVAHSTLNDPQALFSVSAAGTPQGAYQGNSNWAINGTVAGGAGGWTFVAGTTNTWEGSVLNNVNTGATIDATGALNNGNQVAGSQASVLLNLDVRLTFVGGVRLQPDL